MDITLFNEARKNTAFEDIMSFEGESVNESDLKEFAKEYYKVIDASERSDVICDFTCDKDILPFNDIGMQNEEWFVGFEEYLVELWGEKIIQYLHETQDIYINDVCDDMGCC